jgi:hypothetical protein
MDTLNPPPGPASCQDGFPAGASVFRLPGALRPGSSGFKFRAIRPRGATCNLKKGNYIMTDTNNTAPAASKAPTHFAYHVREGKEKGNSFWTRIGAAWQHGDAKGFNLLLDVVPLDGRVSLRIASDKKD